MNSTENNKRIAKNTLFLYVRMFLMMGISLYTSRVVLRVLGVDDYGIYNLVGGIVVLFSFLNGAMTTATQRFLSYDIGRGDMVQLRRTFSMSLNCHFVLSFILIILAETVGLWFFSTQLVIPVERQVASQWVYQFSILSFIFGIIQVPYNSAIISYEKMSFFSLVSILDVVLKLAVVYCLLMTEIDRLIMYAALMALVSIVGMIVRYTYCKLVFAECQYIKIWDKKLFKDIFCFSGWSMFNAGANITAQQGGNILVNLYSGVAANAAYGIANQVSNAIYGFVSSFQTAFQPQIVKLYAQEEYSELFKLSFWSSRVSYYLMLIIVVPFLADIDWILELWLVDVPANSAVFCGLILAYFLIDALQAPLWMIIYATGKIRSYTIWSGAITFLNIPISLLCLIAGAPIYSVFITRIALNFITSIIRTIYMRPFLAFPLKDYLKNVILNISYPSIIAGALLIYIYKFGFVWDSHIITIIVSFMIIASAVFFVGLKREERVKIFNLIKIKLWR